MSSKELAIQLINETPEHKLGYVVAYLMGLNADEAADDAFCDKLYENYKSSGEHEFVSFEETAKMCGVNLNDIQNQN